MKTRVRQCRLRSGNSITWAWIDTRFRTGEVVRLLDSDDPARLWTIEIVGQHEVDKDQLHHTWHNDI